MESKKTGILRQLRLRARPLLTSMNRVKLKPSKQTIQIEQVMDHRMSSSVPDLSAMRQEYSQVSPSVQLPQYNTPSVSNCSTPALDQRDGSGWHSRDSGKSGRSEHRLQMPVDCIHRASSHESFNSLCEEKRSSESNYFAARGMEPEELPLPEMTAVCSPDTVELSQDSSQVHKLLMQAFYQ